MGLVVALTMFGTGLVGCQQSGDTAGSAPGPSFGERIKNADREPENWLSHGRTYDEQRFSPLDQINVETVSQLGLAWSYDLDTNRGQEATPLIVDGIMYSTSAWSKVQALDAATGRLLWQFDPEVPGEVAVNGCCDVVNRGAAYWDGKIYIGAFDGRLIALDAKTGKQIWSTRTTDQTQPYTITGAPRVIKGQVIIGNSGGEMGVRGYVSAYDAETGRLTWRFYTVPGEPGKKDGAASDSVYEKFALASWSGQWWKAEHGRGGGTVWDSMAYDPELDLLYVGTGNGSYWNKATRNGGEGDNLFLASIIALKPETGEYVWHFQQVPGDQWDYTATQHITLADLTIDGRRRKVLMQAPKNGYFYVLDRQTGAFISGKPYIPLNWSKGLDPKTGRPDIVAEARYHRTGKPWLAMPGSLGGHSWHPMAFNRKTGLVYIPTIHVGGVYANDASFKRHLVGANTGIDMSAFKLPTDAAVQKAALASMRGFLIAWDPVAQKEVWRQPNPGFWNGGVLTTSGGLVVQGDNDGFLNIYDARSGRKLGAWDVQSPVMAAPVTYSVNGRQFISVVAGYGGAVGLFAGKLNWGKDGPRQNKSRVLTFAIGGTAKLPALERVAPAPLSTATQFADASIIAKGSQLYHRTCVFCHGADAVGTGVLPDLRRSVNLESRETWYDIVGNGALAANGMASFKADYSPADIEAIRSYIIDQAANARSEGEE